MNYNVTATIYPVNVHVIGTLVSIDIYGILMPLRSTLSCGTSFTNIDQNMFTAKKVTRDKLIPTFISLRVFHYYVAKYIVNRLLPRLYLCIINHFDRFETGVHFKIKIKKSTIN